jgi:hypothetical protein
MTPDEIRSLVEEFHPNLEAFVFGANLEYDFGIDVDWRHHHLATILRKKNSNQYLFQRCDDEDELFSNPLDGIKWIWELVKDREQ